MFKIENLDVSVEDKKILKNFSINVNAGELHVIMGPNGSGKSTLTNTIALMKITILIMVIFC